MILDSILRNYKLLGNFLITLAGNQFRQDFLLAGSQAPEQASPPDELQFHRIESYSGESRPCHDGDDPGILPPSACPAQQKAPPGAGEDPERPER